MISTSLNLNLRPSKYLLTLLLLVYSGPILFLGLLPSPIWINILLQLLCIANLYFNAQRYAFLASPTAVIRLGYTKADGWRLHQRNHKILTGTLLGSSYSAQYLIVLNFKVPNTLRKRNVIILRDMVTSEEFRQLKIRMKLSR